MCSVPLTCVPCRVYRLLKVRNTVSWSSSCIWDKIPTRATGLRTCNVWQITLPLSSWAVPIHVAHSKDSSIIKGDSHCLPSGTLSARRYIHSRVLSVVATSRRSRRAEGRAPPSPPRAANVWPRDYLRAWVRGYVCRTGAAAHIYNWGGKIYYTLPEAMHRGAYRRSVRAKRGKKFSPSFFTYQDGLSWHLRAFALQVPDVRGLQVPGPPCASFLLKFRSRT